MEIMYKQIIEREGQTFKLTVSYTKGGMSYISSQQEDRGYYMSVTPVDIEELNGYRVERTSSFSGYRGFLFPVARKSNKKTAEAISLAYNKVDDYINKILVNQ